MIFKTFDSDSDDFIDKIGILDRTIGSLKNTYDEAKKSGENFQGALKESIKQIIPSKENIQSQLIDINSYVKEIDFNEFDFDEFISGIYEIENSTKSASEASQIFSQEFKGNKVWIAKWAAETRGSVRTLDDFKKAYINARQPMEEFNAQLKNSTLSAKAGQIALKGLAMAGNMIIGMGISIAISSAIKAIDHFVNRVEYANETMRNSVAEYKSAKSQLESINNELETQSSRMDELLKKEKLTYAEEGELDELKQITQELLIQQDIASREEIRKSREAASDTIDSFDKQFGDGITKENLDNQISKEVFGLPTDENDVVGNIVSQVKATELLTESQKALNEAISNGEDTTYLSDDVQMYVDQVELFSELLDANISDLQEKLNNLKPAYDDILDKESSGEILSTTDNTIVSTYKEIANSIKLIYEYTRPEAWNNMQIDSIFNADGIEKSKNDLIEMAKVGTLSPEVISGYKNLNNAISNSELFLENGESAAKAFCDEIYACVNAEKELNLQNNSPSSTVTSTIKQISTQLQPQFAKLKEAYQEIFTVDKNGKESFSLDAVDNEMLEGIRSAFAEISDEIGVEFNSDALEPFFRVLSDGESTAEQVQQAFNNLATTYLYSTDVLSGLNAETATSIEKQLEEMGVTNAQEVVAEALAGKNEELAISKIQCADTGKYLADMTDSEAATFIAEQIEAGNCGAALATLQLKKMLVNNTLLDTETDINAVLALAQAAGLTSDALTNLARIKAQWQTAVDSNDAKGIYEAEKAMSKLRDQVENDVNNFQPVKVDFGTPGTASNAASAGKEAADKYVEAFEKELKQLDTLKERGKINEKQYLDALRALYEKYFKDREKYLDKYQEYEYKYLQGMKSIYESAMGGIIGILDDHISALNDEKDAAIDSLEAQRDAAIEALEAKKEQIEAEKELIQEKIDSIDKEIEAKQDQIDAINDEAEAKKKAYDLDKAQYELDRLKNQRTIYEYSGKEKGFVYKVDDQAIRDQQMEVEDIEREIRIDQIEKEIDLLEKQKEVLQDQQEELEKQQAAIDKRIDAMNDYYDNLIANTEAYWDNMIKGFEETKSRWEELQELQEKAELDTLLKSVTGKGIDEVLAMTEADFNAFKELYLSNVAAINSGNQQMLDSLSKISGVDLSSLPNYLGETAEYIGMLSTGIDFSNMNDSLGGVIDSFGRMAESAGLATGAIIGGGFTSSTSGSAGSGGKGEGGKGSAGQSSGSDLNSAVDTLKTEAIPKVNELGDAFDGGSGGENGEASASGGVAGAVATVRDAIGPGGGGESGKGGGKGESGEGSNLQDTLDTQTQAALDSESGIPAQRNEWLELDSVLASVQEHLSNIKNILENMPEVEVTGGSLQIFATGTDPGFKIGNAYAKGVDGLKHAEKNALRSEYGQPELTVYPNGKAELTTSPVMSNLPKGTVIYNEKQTMDILDGKSGATEIGTSIAINPIFEDMAMEFQRAVQSDPAALLSGVNTQMENISKDLHPVHIEQKNLSNSYVTTTIGDIHLHEVQNVTDLSRAIATKLPTLVKQELSIKR